MGDILFPLGATARFEFAGPLTRFTGSSGVLYPVRRRASIKDAVEALGVPHTEIGSIRFDGEEVGFSELLPPGVVVVVSPIEPPMDVTLSTLLRPRPLAAARFLADVNVGKLARLMRLLGLDVYYRNDLDDQELAELALEEGRIVLTKDRALLKRSKIEFGRHIQPDDPWEQLEETLAFFGLHGPFQVFSRCLRCNIPIRPIEKARILHRLKPLTKKHFDEFHFCPACEGVYWRGSHHAMLMDRLKEMGIVE